MLLYVDHLILAMPVNSVAEWLAYWIHCYSMKDNHNIIVL